MVTIYMKCSIIFDLCSFKYKCLTFFTIPALCPSRFPPRPLFLFFIYNESEGKALPLLSHRIQKGYIEENLKEPVDDKEVFPFLPSFSHFNSLDRKHICLIKIGIN